MSANLSDVVGRLESITSRLEELAAKGGVGAGESGGEAQCE